MLGPGSGLSGDFLPSVILSMLNQLSLGEDFSSWGPWDRRVCSGIRHTLHVKLEGQVVHTCDPELCAAEPGPAGAGAPQSEEGVSS